MSLELLNRRDDEVVWRALARASGMSEVLAEALWARAQRESGNDPIRTERTFRRLLDEAKDLGKLASDLEGDGSLLDPGKWTRVLDLGRGEAVGRTEAGPKSDIDASALDPATRLRQAFESMLTKSDTISGTVANGDTVRDALRKFRNGQVGQSILSMDGGGLEQILRIADTLISIVETHRDVSEGKQIPATLLSQLESKLGIDLSHVRVHDDAKAASEASKHDAIAFARGTNIYFSQGAYDPSSTEGKQLIAHEVAHVAQQRGNGAAARGAMSEPGSAVEREADRFANAFAGGYGGAGAFRVRESAAAGTISRKSGVAVAIKQWSPKVAGAALDIAKKLSEAEDSTEQAEFKELRFGGGGFALGPLTLKRIVFRPNEAGDKVEKATLHANINAGPIKAEGKLEIDATEGVSGTLNIPINAPNMLSIQNVAIAVGPGEISTTVKAKPTFESKHFSVKDTDVDVTVTSKGGEIDLQVLAYTKAEIKNGFANGEGELDLDLKANKKDGVSFNARVKGKIQVAGLSEADATIFFNGKELKMEAGGKVNFNLPGLEGIANIKYELGKLSLDSDNLKFTWPSLSGVAFDKVSLGGESKLKAELHLNKPISFNVAGSTIALEHSTIKIDGKKVEGEITGSFALNNVGGFKAKTTLGYAEDGGFYGSVGVEGGASFKVGPATVSLEPGSKLDITKPKEGEMDIAGDITAKAKLPAIGEIGVHLKAAKGKPVELEADATVGMDKIHDLLVGQLHVKYNRKDGKNEFELSAKNVSAKVEQIKDQPLITEVKAHIAGNQVTGELTIANGTEIKISPTSSLTLLGGTIHLKPGGVLDGTVKAGAAKGESAAQAEFGWKDGNFLWAVEADFELSEPQFTNKVLYGKVHAAADSGGHGSFTSNGDITFGNEKLKDIKITHLSGNKQEKTFKATINARQAIDKAVAGLPVKIDTTQGDVTVTYKDDKIKFDAQVGGTVKYPKEGEERMSGRFMVGVDSNGGFEAKIDQVHVKAGELFESEGGSVDSTTHILKPGTAKFKIDNLEGTINEATQVNIKTGDFLLDVNFNLKEGPLGGVKFNATVDKTSVKAKIAENSPPIELGKFATMTLTDQTEVNVRKGTGFDATIVGTVDAKNVGKGTFAATYNGKAGLKGTASIDVEPFAMFDKIHADIAVENRKISTTNEDGIKLALASQYTDRFDAEAKIKIVNNDFDVKGHVKEIKNLGRVSDAFKEKGATIEWNKQSGVKVEAGIALDKVIPQLAKGSDLTFKYAGKKFEINGTLKPAEYGPVKFKPESHITAHWTSETNKLDVNGHCAADIANLCEAEMNVAANKGGGEPGAFYLDGKIDATKLSAKVPGVKFGSVVAVFGVQIGGPVNSKPEMNFGLTATTTHIAGLEVQSILTANYKTGEGFGGMLNVTKAKLGPVTADGFIKVEKNKFAGGQLNVHADFPSLRIDGTAEVNPGEMDGLDTKANLKVTPTADSAVAKFVQSGEINVEMKKWKVAKAEGILNLVPPSFLPLVDPKIIVKYAPEDMGGNGISAVLDTKFPVPQALAKNGEMGTFRAGYEKPRGLFAHVEMPITVPGFRAATVTGDLDKTGVTIGVDLFPKNDAVVKQARVEVGYLKDSGFYVEGKIRLKPTESLELELGLRYSQQGGLEVIGITPDDKEAEKNEEHDVAKFAKHIDIPLATVGVASLNLRFGMEVGAGYRMPKIKFKNPKLEGGLDALDSGGIPNFTFGGSIAMGAYIFFALSVQIVGEIELLIASASAGIGAEIMARLNLEMGADVDGRYRSGEGALITIDPYVSAQLELIAQLIATLYAEIGWWTIIDKKWVLAKATLAKIDLGRFQPFSPVGLAFGGPKGTHLTRGLSLREDAFDNVQKGVEEGGSKAADREANREAIEKITPVLQSFKNAAPQFQELPEGWEKGMVAAPVDFNSMFPVEEKKWDFYMDHADTAEDLVPELRMTTPTEKLAKAVAVTAKRDSRGAGRLILGWRRAQIAAKGINPDTGVNVIEERVIVQQLIEEKYQKDLAEAQEKQKKQDEEHATHVAKQGSDFSKAEAAHTQVAVQQKAAFDQNVNKIQNQFDKAQEKKAEAGKVAAAEGADVKPVAQEKAPPPPKPAPPPAPPALGKPAPIPVPPPIPLPPPAEILPAVTLPALPADPGVDVKAAAVIPPQKKKAEAESPGKQDAPQGGAPNPTPGATSNSAAQSAGAGGTPLPPGESTPGAGAKGGGSSTTATPPPGPVVKAGPDGIISQNKTIDGKHKQYDPAFAGAKASDMGTGKDAPVAGFTQKPGAPNPAAKDAPGAPGAKDGKAAPGAAVGGDAGAKAGGPAGPGGGAPLDPTVQKVVDEGKKGEDAQKQQLDASKQKYDAGVQKKTEEAAAETKKLDKEAAEAKKKKEEEKKAADAKAAAAAAAPKPGEEKKDGDKPKGPYGIKVTIDVLGSAHTLYIDEVTGQAMVDPPPMAADIKISEAITGFTTAPESIKQPGADAAKAASTAVTALNASAKKAIAGDEGAKSGLAGQEDALAKPLGTTWSWLKLATEPGAASIDKPLEHPYYKDFRNRSVLMVTSGVIKGVNVQTFTEDIWIKICEAVKKAAGPLTDPAALGTFVKDWAEHKQPQFITYLKEFDKIGDEIAKASKTEFSKAESIGIWSTPEGKALAAAMTTSSFEMTAVAKLMEGMPNLDGAKSGWDPTLWGPMAKAFAENAVPEIIKGKTLKVCIGAGTAAGNVWDAAETAALERGLKQAGVSLEKIAVYFAAAPKSKADRGQLDETKTQGSVKGCVYLGDKAGAVAAADANFKTVPDVAKPGDPAQADAAKAEAAKAEAAKAEAAKAAAPPPTTAAAPAGGATPTGAAPPPSNPATANDPGAAPSPTAPTTAPAAPTGAPAAPVQAAAPPTVAPQQPAAPPTQAQPPGGSSAGPSPGLDAKDAKPAETKPETKPVETLTVPKSIVVPVVHAKSTSAELEKDALKMVAPVEVTHGGDAAETTKAVIAKTGATLDQATGALTIPKGLDAATLGSSASVKALADNVAAQLAVSKVRITKTDGTTLSIEIGINPEAHAGDVKLRKFSDRFAIGAPSPATPLHETKVKVRNFAKPAKPAFIAGGKDKIHGYVINTVTIPKNADAGLVSKYLGQDAHKGGGNEGIAINRTGIAIGVNAQEKLDKTASDAVATLVDEKIGGMEKAAPAGAVVGAIGYTWEPTWTEDNKPVEFGTVRKAWEELPDPQRAEALTETEGKKGKDGANEGATAQSHLPYGVIRSKVTDGIGKEAATALSSDVIDPVHIVAQDVDGNLTTESGDGVLGAYDKVLKEMPVHPLMTIGGYRFKGFDWGAAAGSHKQQLTELANEIDRAIREAIAKIAPQVLYPTEPNMLIKAIDKQNNDGLYDKNITGGWGPGATEGRTLKQNVLAADAAADKPNPNPIVIAPQASIVTSPEPDNQKRGLSIFIEGVDLSDPSKAIMRQSQGYQDPATAERETAKALGIPREKDLTDPEKRKTNVTPVFDQADAAAQTMTNPKLSDEERKQQIAEQKKKIDAAAAELAKQLTAYTDNIELAKKIAHAIIDTISGDALAEKWAELRKIFDEINKTAAALKTSEDAVTAAIKVKPPEGGGGTPPPGGPPAGPSPGLTSPKSPTPPPPPQQPPAPPKVVAPPPPKPSAPITEAITGETRSGSLIADPKAKEVYLDLGTKETLTQGSASLAQTLPEEDRAQATALANDVAPIKKEMETEIKVDVPAGGPSPGIGASEGDGLLTRIRTKLKSIASRIASLFKKKPQQLALPASTTPTPDAQAQPTAQNQNPPAQTPPAQTPPAQTPPAQTPPAQTPPAQTPPAQTPPAQVQNAPVQTQNPTAQTPPAQTPPAQVQNPPAEPPKKTPEEELKEAIEAKDAAKIDQLTTTAEARKSVLEQVKKDLALVEKLVAQNKANWLKLAIAQAIEMRSTDRLKRFATDAASKVDAVKEAIAQSKAADLLIAIGSSGDATWKAAVSDADYKALVTELSAPVVIKEINSAIWLLWGDGTGRDPELTFNRLYSANVVPAGDTSVTWESKPYEDKGQPGFKFQDKYNYVTQAVKPETLRVFLSAIKTIPPSHVTQARIAFSNTYEKLWRETAPTLRTYASFSPQKIEQFGTSYYLDTSKTVVMHAEGGAVAPAVTGGQVQVAGDGKPTAVGGTLESSPDGLMTIFQNHARHEIGHAVGARVFKGMGESGDDFANAYGGWQPSDADAMIKAYWTLKGETEIDFSSIPGGAPKEKVKDLDVAHYLIGLLESEGVEPPGNPITAILPTAPLASKLTLLAAKYHAQPLWQYSVAISSGGFKGMKNNGYLFSGFTPPTDRVYIWCDRNDPKGYWTYSKAAYEALHSSHGWYSLASHKEMFAEMYTKKYAGGAAASAVNGKDPAAFFKALEASTDTDTLSSVVPAAKPKAEPAKDGATKLDAAPAPPAKAPTTASVDTPPKLK